MINLIKELQEFGFEGLHATPKVHCKAFEDNSVALEMAKVPKMRPRTKHINVIYHHFRSFVRHGTITLSTKFHPCGIFSKFA